MSDPADIMRERLERMSTVDIVKRARSEPCEGGEFVGDCLEQYLASRLEASIQRVKIATEALKNTQCHCYISMTGILTPQMNTLKEVTRVCYRCKALDDLIEMKEK